MAGIATGAEVLAERSVWSAAETLPTVLDDLMLTIEHVPRAEEGDEVAFAGVWVGQLRRIGAAKLNYWGLSSLVESAVLLISELVTNALKHGKGSEIRFRLILGTDRGTDLVVVEVDDGSPGRPEVRNADADEESGRGMLLVAATAHRWGVSEDETTTWCTLTSPAVARRAR